MDSNLHAVALRRAKRFMEESTLLRIVRNYLETTVLEPIQGEAEGFHYALTGLSFPSLNTTRCLCFLKHPDAVLSKRELSATMPVEISPFCPPHKKGNRS